MTTTSDWIWTDARKRRLTELWDSGFTAEEIASDIGAVSRCAVLGKVHRMKLSARVETVSSEELQRRREKRREIDAARRRYRHENQRYARFIGKVAKSKPEKPQPKDAPMFTGSLDVTFNNLRDFSGVAANQCRFPIGEFFCGVETPAGKSWCRFHFDIVYGVGRELQISQSERDRRVAQAFKNSKLHTAAPSALRCSWVAEA